MSTVDPTNPNLFNPNDEVEQIVAEINALKTRLNTVYASVLKLPLGVTETALPALVPGGALFVTPAGALAWDATWGNYVANAAALSAAVADADADRIAADNARIAAQAAQLAAETARDAAGSGRLLARFYYNGPTTASLSLASYPLARKVRARLWGASGAGGNLVSSGDTNRYTSGGGGGGAYAEFEATVDPELTTAISIQCGTRGSAPAGGASVEPTTSYIGYGTRWQVNCNPASNGQTNFGAVSATRVSYGGEGGTVSLGELAEQPKILWASPGHPGQVGYNLASGVLVRGGAGGAGGAGAPGGAEQLYWGQTPIPAISGGKNSPDLTLPSQAGRNGGGGGTYVRESSAGSYSGGLGAHGSAILELWS